MLKKSLSALLLSLPLIALPLTASAAQMLCSSSIQFEPSEITINTEDPRMVPVMMTQMLEGNAEMCDYSFKLFDGNGNEVGNKVALESIIDVSNNNFQIDFEKNDFLNKEMKNDGIYTLEIYDNRDNSIKGTLDISLLSGSVLGVSHQRSSTNALYVVLALVVMAGGVGIYVARQR